MHGLAVAGAAGPNFGLMVLFAATAFCWRPVLAEDTVETDSEFTIRENPNFPLPTVGDRDRFLTGEGHIEGLFQFNHVSPDAAGLSPYSSVFAVAEARANINLGPYFSINGLLRFDRGQELTIDAAFNDQVLFFQRLFESFTCDHCTFMPGRFIRGSASAGTPLPDCTVAIMTSTTSWWRRLEEECARISGSLAAIASRRKCSITTTPSWPVH